MKLKGGPDGEVVRQGNVKIRMPACELHGGGFDDPAAGGRGTAVRGAVTGAAGGEDVVETLPMGVLRVWVNGGRVTGPQLLLARLGPTPRVVDAVAGDAVDAEVELCRGDGPAADGLGGVAGRPEGAVRVKDAPGVADGGAAGYDAVGERLGQHVEVAEGHDEVAARGGGTEELG